jgi:FkbM family methyltransferase
MLKSLARAFVKGLQLLIIGICNKIAVLLIGRSNVSTSCQIPELRQKYSELGLNSRTGVFVEVGAFDGEEFSNTSFLADQGWRGLYIEPIPGYCRRINQRHLLNNVLIENVAISDVAGECELSVMGPLSTMNAGVLEAYGKISWAENAARASTRIRVRTVRLAEVMERNNIPRNFDLMVIDVEGAEEPIVNSLLASPWRSAVLIVELCDRHPDFMIAPELQKSHKMVRERIIAAGYEEFYSDPINSIFRLG